MYIYCVYTLHLCVYDPHISQQPEYHTYIYIHMYKNGCKQESLFQLDYIVYIHFK